MSPSPFHGVTTVIGGNCGFSIAPLAPEHADYLMRMMARVEGMPLEALIAGPKWDWGSYGEWLGRLDGRLLINAGFLVGHSTLRRLAMGDAAVGRAASDKQIARMVAMAHEALAAGALGFSTSLGEGHTDGDGQPVPSRAAKFDEILALAAAVRDHPGTSLELIPAMGEIPAERVRLMTDMSLAANRVVNWNLLGNLSPVEVYEQQLAASDWASERGAVVVALALPDLLRMRGDRLLEQLPGWHDILALSGEDRRRAAHDPATRERLRRGVTQAVQQGLEVVQRWDLVEVAASDLSVDDELLGHTIAELADRRGVEPVDALIDVVVRDGYSLTVVFPSLLPTLGTTPEAWQTRANVWKDHRVVLGGSDAGAHLDLMCHANYTTVVLGEMVRERELFDLEDAIRRLTDVPARLIGLRDRGQIRAGAHADLVVFDPDEIGSEPSSPRFDLPGGACRLYAEARGIKRVFVNGQEAVDHGRPTATLAGQLIRSGSDTNTVGVPGGARS
jgi:N-acyl-D-aspartate/D-glutamate deacylase